MSNGETAKWEEIIIIVNCICKQIVEIGVIVVWIGSNCTVEELQLDKRG